VLVVVADGDFVKERASEGLPKGDKTGEGLSERLISRPWPVETLWKDARRPLEAE
jgi:hypothetical protein